MAFGDFDNDGDVDILIMNQNEPPSLLRNDVSGDYHWLKAKLVGTKSNRSAIGARVRLTAGGLTQIGEVRSGGSYLSQSDLRLHFGLGSARSIERLEIRWPSGGRQVEQVEKDLPVNRVITIREKVVPSSTAH